MLERMIIEFDRGLRTIFAPARASRPSPSEELSETALEPKERAQSAALMRVNHSGEVAAQALYQGQAAVARSTETKSILRAASSEEEDHLAWTEQRIAELHGRKSFLNPLWYVGSFAIGVFAGFFGDKPSYSFLAETERQVTQHLDEHLTRLPAADSKSRAILFEMREDEAKHATTANSKGAMPLPAPIVFAMRMASKVMTRTSYWL